LEPHVLIEKYENEWRFMHIMHGGGDILGELIPFPEKHEKIFLTPEEYQEYMDLYMRALESDSLLEMWRYRRKMKHILKNRKHQ
jgi:hypothetical protein